LVSVRTAEYQPFKAHHADYENGITAKQQVRNRDLATRAVRQVDVFH
jgi:hypothetical protein